MIYIDSGSNTYGDELTDRENQAWPFLLDKSIGVPVINSAIKGKSNQHIIFDLINFCSSNNPSLVIIGWVNVNRKLVFRRENNFPVDFSINGNNSIYNKDKTFEEFKNLHFKYWSNDLNDNWVFLQSVILTQNFLKSLNIPYLMFNDNDKSDILKLTTINQENIQTKKRLLDSFDCMPNTEINNVAKQFSLLYNMLDHTNYYDFSWNLKKLIDFKYHPTSNDHKIILEFMLPLITNKLCLK